MKSMEFSLKSLGASTVLSLKRSFTAVRLVPALLIGSLAASLLSAEVAEITPSKDNTLYEDSNGSLSNGSGSGLFTGQTGEGRVTRALLAFDLSAIPAGSIINSASLTLEMSRSSNGDDTPRATSVHRVLKDWGEGSSVADGGGGRGGASASGDATWRHTFFDSQLWDMAGGDFEQTASATINVGAVGTYSWDSNQLVADVQGWVDNPSMNFGWLIRGEEGSPSTAKRFRSRHNSSSIAPQLTVDFTAPVVEEGKLALIFTQFVNGQTGPDLNQSRVILRNNGDSPVSGQIKFRASQTGAPSVPTSLPIGGEMVDQVDFELDAWGTLDIETDGTGELKTGVIEVFTDDSGSALDSHLSDSDLEGTEVFSILGGFVSVPSSSLESSIQIYVSRNPGENTGLAIYNPDEDETTTLNLILLDDNGSQRATKQIMVLPKQHTALFVDQDPLFTDFFQQNPGPFQGTLNIHVVSGEEVAIVALLQKLPSGALIAVTPSTEAFSSQ